MPRERGRSGTRCARARAAFPEGPAFRRTPSRARDLKDSIEGLAHGKSIGLDEDRIARGAERRDGARAIELVAAKDLGEQVLTRAFLATRRELLFAAPSAPIVLFPAPAGPSIATVRGVPT